MTQPFLVKFMKIWKKNPFDINIQSQLRSHHQIQDISNEHPTFEFQDGLLHGDGLLCILDDPTWFQVLQAKHNAFGCKSFWV